MSRSTDRLKTHAAIAFCMFLFLLRPPQATADPPVVFALPANEEGLARYSRWKPITDYLSGASGAGLVLEMVEDHAAVQRGLKTRLYDLAFVNPLWCEALCEKRLCIPLARPVVLGRDTVRSLLVVHRDSIVRSVDDLAEATIALTGPHESALGYYVPLSLLEAQGLQQSEHERILFSDTFLSVLKGVAYGKLEAGFVSSSVLDDSSNAPLREQVRVILESEALPQWTVVARTELRPQTIAAVRNALLEMGKFERGRAVLAPTGFSAFVQATETDYEGLVRYTGAVEAAVVSPE
jgi:phosphonate transport system substrate-binding protein